MVPLVRVWFDRLMAAGAGICCAAMFGVVFASSLSRYAFGAPFQWSEELAKYSMIYGTMFGVVLAYNRSYHMRFTVLADLLGPRWWVRLNRVAELTAIGVGAILAYSGWLFVVARGGITSSGLGIKMAYPQAAMAVGGLCLIAAALLDLFSRGRGENHEVDRL